MSQSMSQSMTQSATPQMPRIIVWNEGRHELTNKIVGDIYPDGIHDAIAAGLREAGFAHVRTATLDMPEHGLTAEVLAETDVLTWWGHMAHGDVEDSIVERVYQRVQEGMGLIVLHSGHFSKIFKKLMGTTGNLMWREYGEKERLWCTNPAHPIAAGLPAFFELEHEEMYGEPFGIPEPDSLVFVSWFSGGEVFRSGACWYRGQGKVFYFRPGHETHPTYYDANIRRVIANAALWAAPTAGPAIPVENRAVPLEPITRWPSE